MSKLLLMATILISNISISTSGELPDTSFSGNESNANCRNSFEIENIDSIGDLTGADDFKECPRVSSFKNKRELKGSRGCKCVESRNNPISCDTFLNFQSLLVNNQEVLAKTSFLNNVFSTLKRINDIQPTDKYCDIQEELKSCIFEEDQFSLENIFTDFGKYLSNPNIKNIDDISIEYKDNGNNDAHLLYNQYLVIQSIAQKLDSYDSLDDTVKDEIQSYIDERKLLLRPILQSAITQRSTMQNRFHFVANNARIRPSQEAITRSEKDGVLPSDVRDQLSSVPNWELLEKRIKEELEGRILSRGSTRRRVIDEFFLEHEKFKMESWQEEHNRFCSELKQKIPKKCEYLKKIDSGDIKPIIKLNQKELISLLKDKAAEKIPPNISPSKKSEYIDEIRYNLEWYTCATNNLDDSEKFNKFVNLNNCSSSVASFSEEEFEQADNFNESIHENYYDESILSEEEKSQIEEVYSYIEDEYDKNGLVTDDVDPYNNSLPSTKNFASTNFNESNKSNGNYNINQKNINNSGSKNATANDTASGSYDPYRDLGQSIARNIKGNGTNISSENSPDQSMTSDSDSSNDQVKSLLEELKAKRLELEDLKKELAKAKKVKNSQKESEINENINKTKKEIANIENNISSIPRQSQNDFKDQVEEITNSNRGPASSSVGSSISSSSSNSENISRSVTSAVTSNLPITPASKTSSASQYGMVSRTMLKGVAEDFELNDTLSIVGDSISRGVINFQTNQDGDLLQIWGLSETKKDKLELKFQWPLVGQGIPSVLLSLKPKKSNFKTLEKFEIAKKDFLEFENQVWKAYSKHTGIDISELRNPSKPEDALKPKKARKAKYENFTDAIEKGTTDK